MHVTHTILRLQRLGASVLLPQQCCITVCGALCCAVGAVEHINCLRPGLLSAEYTLLHFYAVCARGCDMVCVYQVGFWPIATLVGGSPVVVLLVFNSPVSLQAETESRG